MLCFRKQQFFSYFSQLIHPSNLKVQFLIGSPYPSFIRFHSLNSRPFSATFTSSLLSFSFSSSSWLPPSRFSLFTSSPFSSFYTSFNFNFVARFNSHMAPVPPVKDSTQNGSPIHQVVIIGSGPAAHTAAIYTGRANLNPIVYEGFMAGGIAPGGQLTTTTEVENFPGFPKGIMGSELMEKMREQSIHCGANIITETVSKVDFSSRPFKLWIENKETEPPVLAHSVILATGATARRLHLPGEEQYWNKGMSACAVCDGPAPLFRNQPVMVMGGGDSACEEAMYMTKYASKVYLLHRRDQLRASKIMADRVLSHPSIELVWNSIPIRMLGNDSHLTHVILQNVKTFQEEKKECRGFFYAIGHTPNLVANHTSSTEPAVQIDSDGYVITRPGTMMTSNEGVFACGDLVDKKYRQAITAAGMGCQAALECERWLEAQEH